jgi:hypothetical protein
MFRRSIIVSLILGFLGLAAAPAIAAPVRHSVPAALMAHKAKAAKFTKGKKPKGGKKHHHSGSKKK